MLSVVKSFAPGTPSEPGKYPLNVWVVASNRQMAPTSDDTLFVAGLSGLSWPRRAVRAEIPFGPVQTISVKRK